MGWENIDLPNCNLGSVLSNFDYWFTTSRQNGTQNSPYNDLEYFPTSTTFRIEDYNGVADGDYYLYGDSSCGLLVRKNSNKINLYLIQNNVVSEYFFESVTSYSYSTQYPRQVSVIIGIDRDREVGTVFVYYRYYQPSIWDWQYAETCASGQLVEHNDVYLWAINALPQTYNWQSVPSISGKNGILNLSQIASASINDGEAVSGASASAFDILESSSRIDALVNVAELDNGKARATYTIPPLTSGSYSYAKLTYKRGYIPTNKDDGTSVDLDTTDLGTTKTIDVSGIITGSVYWFVIFTDKSESEPKQLGANTEGLFFQIDLSTDGKDIVRYDASKTINNHKQGELYNNAGNPGYTISDGVLDVTSVGNQRDIEWAYDTSENPQTIPQNCTLTFEYDCYFPNGMGYLDWYVYDSNIIQVIYWCFDTKFSFQANKWYNCKTVCKLVDGKITRCKYVVDGVEVSGGSITPIDMPCTDKEGSKGISYIDFNLTQRTKFKNMSIYYDFSEYTDHGGGGSGSSGQS